MKLYFLLVILKNQVIGKAVKPFNYEFLKIIFEQHQYKSHITNKIFTINFLKENVII